MRQLHPLMLALLLATGGQQAFGNGLVTEATESRFSGAALCVAVLEREVKSGLHVDPTPQEREQWQRRLESAFAHIGNAYLSGLSGSEGKALLRSTEASVSHWPEQRLKSQAQTCHDQGQALLGQAMGLQKMIVRNSAERLLNKELAKLPRTRAP
ncbi:MAG: hypothetical protein NTX37_04185 [Burkholderiales bacterium]|nr:hypothetical protein [Burkholderiales bacterium]